MKKLIAPLLLTALLLSSCNKKQPIDYVNPFIGTDGHGHTYPGAVYPFGMVQLSPDTRLEGWDGCSGYHYSDSIIYGFSHTHLSGTGVSDYGDILFMPIDGDTPLYRGDDKKDGYRSDFDKKNEKASAGYYSVKLNKYNVNVELTSTNRVGVHKYSFKKPVKPGLIIDLQHRDFVIESSFKIINDTTIAGMRRSKAWAEDQVVYFYATLSAPIKEYSISVNDTLVKGQKHVEGKNIISSLHFDNTIKEIIAKVGISSVDIDGAKNNLLKEAANKSFNQILDESRLAWNKQLKKIFVEGGTPEQFETFYTALYHTMIVPNTLTDVDGRYRAMDKSIQKSTDGEKYTIFSLWDTYRATHPLYTLIEQNRTKEFVKTFISQYKSGGIIPIWELASNYTGCMIGYHAIPVIADAYLKGIYTQNDSLLLAAMVNSADQNKLGLDKYKENGFIAISDDAESVSKTLEYAFDDWCIAKVAKKMGRDDIYNRFIVRAQSYKNVFDPQSKFMRAKLNNVWKNPFDPREVDFNYTEANSWQYSFYAPQDINTLVDMHGGNNQFATMLDSMFSATTKTVGRQQSDITGLIGQYAHGNEPSHHMAYLYNYVGQPWKTQSMVRKIMAEQYSNKPDGLCGNEDCGQMSAWYVFSAMGLYPVNPANGEYAIGSPIFDKVAINLENGKKFEIWSNSSDERKYISAATLNKKMYNKSYITHNDIMNGGLFIMKMKTTPSDKWGVKKESLPISKIDDKLIVPAPFIKNAKRTFVDSTIIEFGCADTSAKVYYYIGKKTLYPEGFINKPEVKEYTEPITINNSCFVQFVAKTDSAESVLLHSQFYKTPSNIHVKLANTWHKQYSAGGNEALIDGITGSNNFRTGDWQGFYEKDLDAEIHFDRYKSMTEISVNFIQDARSWIFMPTKVEFFISYNGTDFVSVGTVENTVADTNTEVSIETFKKNFSFRWLKAIKVVASNPKVCPQWHPGAGLGAFIFADEIVFK